MGAISVSFSRGPVKFRPKRSLGAMLTKYTFHSDINSDMLIKVFNLPKYEKKNLTL